MTGAAISDALTNGPEIISLHMTGVLMVYSSLFARWAFVVRPQNLLLCSCHVSNLLAQANQMRRSLEYHIAEGRSEMVYDYIFKASLVTSVMAFSCLAGPRLRVPLVSARIPYVSSYAATDAGPFTVHFWAPMSKWLISGASFFELDRPVEKISVSQYTALTFTGFFFSRCKFSICHVCP